MQAVSGEIPQAVCERISGLSMIDAHDNVVDGKSDIDCHVVKAVYLVDQGFDNSIMVGRMHQVATKSEAGAQCL